MTDLRIKILNSIVLLTWYGTSDKSLFSPCFAVPIYKTLGIKETQRRAQRLFPTLYCQGLGHRGPEVSRNLSLRSASVLCMCKMALRPLTRGTPFSEIQPKNASWPLQTYKASSPDRLLVKVSFCPTWSGTASNPGFPTQSVWTLEHKECSQPRLSVPNVHIPCPSLCDPRASHLSQKLPDLLCQCLGSDLFPALQWFLSLQEILSKGSLSEIPPSAFKWVDLFGALRLTSDKQFLLPNELKASTLFPNWIFGWNGIKTKTAIRDYSNNRSLRSRGWGVVLLGVKAAPRFPLQDPGSFGHLDPS